MAIVHKGRNQLQENARHNLSISIILAIPLILYFLASIVFQFHFNGLYHFLPIILFGGPASYFFSKYGTLKAGVNGEHHALESIRELPDDYHIFTNIGSEFDGKKCETDVLIIGPNGIFVVEVKNHNGTIDGEENGEYWVQHKVGRQGEKYSKQMRNPIKQMKRNVYILAQYFQTNGIKYWIEGIVFFTNKHVDLCVKCNRVYTAGDCVIDHIIGYKSSSILTETKILHIVNMLSNSIDDEQEMVQIQQPICVDKHYLRQVQYFEHNNLKIKQDINREMQFLEKTPATHTHMRRGC